VDGPCGVPVKLVGAISSSCPNETVANAQLNNKKSVDFRAIPAEDKDRWLNFSLIL
jgi:hypothetical protein